MSMVGLESEGHDDVDNPYNLLMIECYGIFLRFD